MAESTVTRTMLARPTKVATSITRDSDNHSETPPFGLLVRSSAVDFTESNTPAAFRTDQSTPTATSRMTNRQIEYRNVTLTTDHGLTRETTSRARRPPPRVAVRLAAPEVAPSAAARGR